MSKNPDNYKTYWMLTENKIETTADIPRPLSFYVYSNTYSSNVFLIINNNSLLE